MSNYEKVLSLGCFSIEDITKLMKNENTAKSAVQYMKNKGLVQSIKRNLYTAVSIETGAPVATPYEIASCITSSSYVSHHSAFEYYGMANQVFEEIYVSSNEKFNPFEFDGRTYKFISSKINIGIENKKRMRITDIERTVIDSIKDFNKIGGFEELLRCIDMMTYVDEDKLLNYLEAYDNQFLYQKTGYILSEYRDNLKLSTGFFDECKAHIKKSVRYLYPDIAFEKYEFNKEWKLHVPINLSDITDEGGEIDV